VFWLKLIALVAAALVATYLALREIDRLFAAALERERYAVLSQ
jgi:hypothetical protein